ncbi:MAG: glycosyl hydrolase family 2, partial [Verrucomicrobia bacterium]|nr:glycosyl hydrolase family 2 [Verrucomicrobiota bacterium]
MTSRALAFTLILAALAPLRAVSAAIEKTWFFTTTDTLTVDLRLAAGTEVDWSASALTLTRTDAAATDAPQRIPLSAAQVHPDQATSALRLTVPSLRVAVWSPVSPVLYQAKIDLATRSGPHEAVTARVGFRSFTTEAGQLRLNGRPIFLRGLAINPPGRGIPETVERTRRFAEDYVRYMLGLNVNIIRIPDDPTWYDVCDELGMMVFGGNYSGSVNGGGSEGNRDAAARWYREKKFHPLTSHPSLMIYALTNEVSGEGAAGAKWDAFLGEIHRQLRTWDPTRLYIANAGYGFGRVGEINDLHRYWGWYYNSPFTFLHLRDYDRLVFPDKVQPLTFTECVGNYNGPDGRTNLSPNHKNPVSQLNWLGHAPDTEQGALGFEHQSFTIRQATELFRRLRPINSELSGVFPFTILFNRWHDIASFSDMDPKPAARQLRSSYQPVLLSWELYTPQVYAGSELHPIAHIVNDANDGSALAAGTLDYEIRDSTQRTVASGRVTGLDVAYYATARRPLAIKLPDSLATDTYTLWGRVTQKDRTLSETQTTFFIAARDYARAGRAPQSAVRLFDPTGATKRAFEQLGLACTVLTAFELAPPLAATTPIVIGEDAAGQVSFAAASALADFAQRGGRLLVLRQSSSHAAALAALLPAPVRLPSTSVDDPAYPPPARPSRDSINVNPERPDHPVFAGLDRRRLQVWSDYTSWDEQQKGFPRIYPVTDGFVLTDKSSIRDVAVLANYSQGLEGVALAEFFPSAGTGSIMLSAFDLSARAGLDPVADRLLR